MKTCIEIDNSLLAKTLRMTGITSREEVIEKGLQTLLRMGIREEAAGPRAKHTWQGHLKAIRDKR